MSAELINRELVVTLVLGEEEVQLLRIEAGLLHSFLCVFALASKLDFQDVLLEFLAELLDFVRRQLREHLLWLGRSLLLFSRLLSLILWVTMSLDVQFEVGFRLFGRGWGR